MNNSIPEEWCSKLFAELIESHNSGIYKKKEHYGEGTPIIGVSDIYKSLFVDGREFRRVPLNQDELHKYTLDEGDLLYGESSLVRSGIARTVCTTKSGAGTAFAWHTRRIKIRKDQASPEFLVYLLDDATTRKAIESVATQTALTGVTTKDYFGIRLTLPSLPEQKKIAAILSSVDNVIEKIRAKIDKLKHLKTGMMQELLTKGIGHTEFKDSPLGRIPSSWNVKSLGALSSFVTSGSRGWAQYYSSSGAIFIRIGNLTREHINLRFEDTVYVTPPASAEGKRTQVTIGDVLISITADLGVIGVVNESIGEAFVNQHISLVRLNEPALARWVGHFLAFENSQKQFIANNDAGAKAGLNLPAIRKTLVAIPAKDEREKIVASLDSVDQDVSLKRDRLQRLLNLKKALMQDLLTGKVRVKVDQKESAVA